MLVTWEAATSKWQGARLPCLCCRRRITFSASGARDGAPQLLRALAAALRRRGVPCEEDAGRFMLAAPLDALPGGSYGPNSRAGLDGQQRERGEPLGRARGADPCDSDPGQTPVCGPDPEQSAQPAKRRRVGAGKQGGCMRIAVLQETPGAFAVSASVPAGCGEAVARRFDVLVGELKAAFGQAAGSWQLN